MVIGDKVTQWEEDTHSYFKFIDLDTHIKQWKIEQDSFTIKCGVAVFCLSVDPYKYLYYSSLPINLYLLIAA